MDEPDLSKLSREQLIKELKDIRNEKIVLIDANRKHEIEIERLRAELRRSAVNPNATTNNSEDSSSSNKFKLELEQAIKKCDRLEKERDKLQNELKMLEGEMDELHDNFREEENEQFEQVKQELDMSLKNCKILQIRLNKCERQYVQLEQVKQMLERQLEEQLTSSSADQSSMGQPGGGASLLGQGNQTQANFIQLGKDCVKLATSDYDQLLRDLSDTIEREKDLQEQIKYSQEEAQSNSDRLQSLEAENEALLSSVQKFTEANAKLRLQLATGSGGSSNSRNSPNLNSANSKEQQSELLEQNEQLKLALDISQSESQHFKIKCQELSGQLETKDAILKEIELKKAAIEGDLVKLRATMLRRANALEGSVQNSLERSETLEDQRDRLAQLELECRQLRSKLIQSERDNKQMKQRILSIQQSGSPGANDNDLLNGSSNSRRDNYSSRSSSVELAGEQVRMREINRQLREECNLLRSRQEELERQLKRLSEPDKTSNRTNKMESDLVDKMRKQLEASESELVKAKSRLVELDIELKRVQRLHKRQTEALESRTEVQLLRTVKLPPEELRDSLSRQELRSALRELELQVDECKSIISSLRCQKEDVAQTEEAQSKVTQINKKLDDSQSPTDLRLSLEHERQMNRKLRGQVEQIGRDLEAKIRFYERERASIDEEVSKLRQVNSDLRTEIDEANKNGRGSVTKIRDLQATCDKLRKELQLASEIKGQSAGSELVNQRKQQQAIKQAARDATAESSQRSGDAQLLARDLAELKVKNGFLMQELELARADNLRQLNELRQANEAQVKRAVELAQLELKENQLAETQRLREELSDCKQKLASLQRQLTRAEEDVSSERDRMRSAERDWRRDKSQFQQLIEQLEAQLALEKRANEFKVKECESAIRDKERELISMQDKCLQSERDLKRTQNKLSLIEENSESKLKKLTGELEAKKRELSDLIVSSRKRDEEYYTACKRFNAEKSTLSEALESIKRSYDEKFSELKSLRELLSIRQEQIYKERSQNQVKLDDMTKQLIRMSDYESQAKLLKHQFQVQEKQADSMKRELLQLKEDKQKLKTKSEKLEARCQQLEKQELLNKTSSISTSTGRSRSPFGFVGSKIVERQPKQVEQLQPTIGLQTVSDSSTTDKLTTKINDQRQMMNLIKRQLGELQLELKQVKLLHSCERLKWQSQVSELTSRLNESEERLLFETSLLVGPVTMEVARKQAEIKWAEERKSSLELINQQQAQNELLTKDLKRTIQAHDMMRLENKQLESHNNKLSRKVIDYQQQLSTLPLEREQSSHTTRDLELKNQRLTALMQQQVRPIIDTMNKILLTIENSENKPASSPKGNADTGATSDEQGMTAAPQSLGSSIKRPLITKAATRRQNSVDSDDSTQPEQNSLLVQSARPAHQLNAANQQISRLSRLISSSKSKNQVDLVTETAQPQISGSKSPVKTVRKVRLRSMSLGLSLSEKKQLKQRLQEVRNLLEELEDRSSLSSFCETRSSEGQKIGWQELDQPKSSGYWSGSGTTKSSRESSQLSVSNQSHQLGLRSNSQRLSYDGVLGAGIAQGYESESSLASDISSSNFSSRARFTSGAESDSCLNAQSATPRKGVKSRGLKGRLTSTIRTISRSLVGLTSDSELEQTQEKPSGGRTSVTSLREARV